MQGLKQLGANFLHHQATCQVSYLSQQVSLTLHNSTAGGQSQQHKEESTLRPHPGCSLGDYVDCGITENET